MLTLKTYGPTERGDVRKLPVGKYALAADFSDETFHFGSTLASFADMFDFTRGAMRYFNPATRRWVVSPENQPLFYSPAGRKGLCLAGSLSAIISGNPSGAGTASTSTVGHTNKVLPIICWGKEDAEITVSGNFEYIDPNITVARPYQPLFIRLLVGSITLAYTDAVNAFKIPVQGWDEWPNSADLFSSAAGASANLSATALAKVNLLGDIVEFSGKYLPHASRFPLNQSQWALQFTDGLASFGFFLHTGSNEWRITNSPNNARILRPTSHSPKAQDLEFRVVWDKVQNLANVWANGNLVNEAVQVPAMGPLTEVSLARNSTNANVDLRASLKYFSLRESTEKITPWQTA